MHFRCGLYWVDKAENLRTKTAELIDKVKTNYEIQNQKPTP